MGRLRKKGIALLKILFSGLLLYLVFTRIPFAEVWKVLRGATPGYLLGALLFFVVSKGVAAERLNLYFHSIGLPLSRGSNLRLYLLGMFYNLFLPGGIGGDAYKGFLLHRTFGASGKKLASVLLLDRVSGLFLLYLLSLLFLLWLPLEPLASYRFLLLPVAGLSLAAFWLAHRKGFPYLMPIFWPSLGYSALVQLSQLACVVFILGALGVAEMQVSYLLVFLVSSIVAVLPITIGGVGSRELVFYYGSKWLALDDGTSIGVSMAFFLITALVSLLGLAYHFRKPGLTLSAAPAS